MFATGRIVNVDSAGDIPRLVMVSFDGRAAIERTEAFLGDDPFLAQEVIASVRAQRWLIPAYHAALDADIRNGHDDPLNFDPESFAESIEALVKKLKPPDEVRAAN